MTMTAKGERVTEEELRRFLGHSESTNTIRRYLHLARTVNQQIPRVFEAVYGSAKGDNASFGAVPLEEGKTTPPEEWLQ